MKALRLKAGLVALTLLITAGCAAAPTTPKANEKPAPAPAVSGETAKPTVTPTPATLTKVKFALAALSATATPVWVAIDEGLFKKYNLEVEPILVTSGSTVVQVIESGDVGLGQGNQAAVVDAALSGADSVLLASNMNTYFFQIYSNTKYNKLEELKGKVIAASAAGSSSDHAVREAMAMAGIKEGQYEVVYVGGTSARLAALQKGVVDAAVISPPEGLKAKEAGFKELVNLIAMGVPFGHSGVQTSKKWLAANRPAAMAFLKGYSEARALIEKNPAIAYKALAKYTETKDQAILDESYRNIVPGIPRIPYVQDSLIKKSLDETDKPKAKTAKTTDFYDNSLIKELEDSGFYKELYK